MTTGDDEEGETEMPTVVAVDFKREISDGLEQLVMHGIDKLNKPHAWRLIKRDADNAELALTYVGPAGDEPPLGKILHFPAGKFGFPVTLEEWLGREDLIPRDLLLGHLLSTTTRGLLIGPTGLGKTMFIIAAAMAIITNSGFLHWAGIRQGRVLIIDGEMPRSEMKRRLHEAIAPIKCEIPAGHLSILSREDVEDMPPLNTPEGQKWLDAFIAARGPFDFIFFDNMMSLMVGSMKDEEAWAGIKDYVLDLTKRRIGQLWLHHTGLDESRGYGSKVKEWILELVGLMERVADADDDLHFTLKWTKHRMRTPDNQVDFRPVTISLLEGEWLHGEGGKKEKNTGRPPANQQLAYEALVSIVAQHGVPLPASWNMPKGLSSVSKKAFQEELLSRGIVDDEGANPRARFGEILASLKAAHRAGEKDKRIWPIIKERGE